MHSEINSVYADYLKDEDAITEEEKRQILDQIRQVAEDNQASAPAEIRPSRKVWLFPLAVNLVVLAVNAVAISGSFLLFHMRQVKLEQEASRYNSVEGEILEEYKRETTKRLEEKDAAILNMLDQLGALERERRQLADLMEIRIQQKEEQLRRGLDAELAERRQALLNDGVQADQAARELDEYRAGKQRQIDEELRAYQEEAERVNREKTARLLQEKEIARQALEQATLEREKVLPGGLSAAQAASAPEPAPGEAEAQGTQADRELIARLQEELRGKEARLAELAGRLASGPAPDPEPVPVAEPVPVPEPAPAPALAAEPVPAAAPAPALQAASAPAVLPAPEVAQTAPAASPPPAAEPPLLPDPGHRDHDRARAGDRAADDRPARAGGRLRRDPPRAGLRGSREGRRGPRHADGGQEGRGPHREKRGGLPAGRDRQCVPAARTRPGRGGGGPRPGGTAGGRGALEGPVLRRDVHDPPRWSRPRTGLPLRPFTLRHAPSFPGSPAPPRGTSRAAGGSPRPRPAKQR